MLKKKLRLTSLDNSGKGVKWNYPEAADLSEDERTLAEVTTRANIAVWLVARGNKIRRWQNGICNSRTRTGRHCRTGGSQYGKGQKEREINPVRR